VLLDLGRLFAGLGYPEEAIEVLERAVADARRDPETVASLADALHLLGQVALEHGDSTGLDRLDEVAALARQHGADWLLADVVDSRARGLATLSRPEEAVSTALTAAELFEAVGATRPAGGSMLFAGRVLQSESRHEEALVLIGQAIERFDGQADAVSLGRIALADSLEALGRLAEAAEARRLAEEV
jgi:tetratricopeptide (TPR) repeat protein